MLYGNGVDAGKAGRKRGMCQVLHSLEDRVMTSWHEGFPHG